MRIKRFILMIIAGVLLTGTVFAPPTNALTYTEDDSFFNSNNILFSCTPSPTNECANTACSTNNSGPTITTVSGNSNLEKIINYLTDAGFTQAQAAGVAGNIQAESGFSATRQEDPVSSFPGGGWGLIQWTNPDNSSQGRRTNVVNYLDSKIPTVMSKYYSTQYGGATDASTGYVAAGISADDNSSLILNEMNFLLQEITTTTVNPDAVLAGYGKAGQTNLAALKQQTSAKAAAYLWVYSDEHPTTATGQAAIQAMSGTAAQRASNAEAILKGLGGSDTDASSGASSTSACGVTDADGTTVAAGPTRTKIVEIAQAEQQKWADGTLKIGGDYEKYTNGAADEWCAYFASWVYSQAGVPLQGTAGSASALIGSSTQVMNVGKAGGDFTWHDAGSYTPQPGDIAVYSTGGVGGIFHVNIVVKATGPKTYSDIGGNEGENIGEPALNIVKADPITDTYWTSQVLGFVSPTQN